MTISIYRWTDGPYLAFNDPDDKRYVLERARAADILRRMSARVGDVADRHLVIDRRFAADPLRDRIVLELYYQDCDNVFEVVTANGPVLPISPVEAGTILRLALEYPADDGARLMRATPQFVQDAAFSVLTNVSADSGAYYD